MFDKKIIEKLSDTNELEKFARERYYLKKKNEEIYLIEYEDSVKNKKKEWIMNREYLFSDFPEVSSKAWKQKIQVDLTGGIH